MIQHFVVRLFTQVNVTQDPDRESRKRSLEAAREPDFNISEHLFMLRLDSAVFGAPREAVLAALEAEGIPCSGGYGFSLNDQPLFRIRPLDHLAL